MSVLVAYGYEDPCGVGVSPEWEDAAADEWAVSVEAGYCTVDSWTVGESCSDEV